MSRRAPKSRKAILDLVSVKKRDTMVGFTQSQSVEPRYFAEIISADNFLLWCPTARERGGQGNGLPTVRSSNNVFWKGIADNFSFESSTSDPWLWRRVVFTMRGGFSTAEVPSQYYTTVTDNIVDITGPTSGQVPTEQTQNVVRGIRSYFRTLEPLPVINHQALAERIFQGVRYVDWTDYTTAKLDTSQIKVISDRMTRMTSGNDSPFLRRKKHYIPLNKRMMYPSTEYGAAETSITTQNDAFAAPGNYGDTLADVYIMDYFRQPSGAPSSMTVTAQSTAYWHER
ncbi:MAG: capsid protein [Genomoviridae sp.]|nr:MAG: capsid protein [Genomoviridae sp.]